MTGADRVGKPSLTGAARVGKPSLIGAARVGKPGLTLVQEQGRLEKPGLTRAGLSWQAGLDWSCLSWQAGLDRSYQCRHDMSPLNFDPRNDGFWGDTTATLDWCETNYEVTNTELIATPMQFVNAFFKFIIINVIGCR